MEDDDDCPPPLTAADLLLAEEEGKRNELEEYESDERTGLEQLDIVERLEYTHYTLHATLDKARADCEAEAEKGLQEIQKQASAEEFSILTTARLQRVEQHYTVEYQALSMDEEDEFHHILQLASINLCQAFDSEHDSKCACKIQRMYRRKRARAKLLHMKKMYDHAKEIQQFMRARLSQELYHIKQEDIQDQCLMMLEEQEQRVDDSKAQDKERKHLLQDFENLRRVIIKEDWERKKIADDKAARADLCKSEEDIRTLMREEENSSHEQMVADLHKGAEDISAYLQKRADDAEYEREMALLMAKHAAERKALEDKEESGRTGETAEEEKGWWTIMTKEPASRSKALMAFIEELVKLHQAEQEALSAQEQEARAPIEQEDLAAMEAMEKLKTRDQIKALERQALREEIERIHVEEEFMYIRSLFLVSEEEDDWAKVEAHGEFLRTELAQEDYIRLMNRVAAEQYDTLSGQENQRNALAREEVAERSRMYKEFTRSFLKMPYQDLLENQVITYNARPYQSPVRRQKGGPKEISLREVIGWGPQKTIRMVTPSTVSDVPSLEDSSTSQLQPLTPQPPKGGRNAAKAAKKQRPSPRKAASHSKLPKVDTKVTKLSYRERVLMNMFGLSDKNGPLDPINEMELSQSGAEFASTY